MKEPLVHIAIPTLDRGDTCLARAIERALAQTYDRTLVTVVDDGSKDGTRRLLRRFEAEERFSAIVLGHNVGTGQAKNVALLVCRYDAITFHDSDDVPSENKVLLQSRALCLDGHVADSILDWSVFGHAPGTELRVDVVVGGYDLVKLDGSVHYINKRVSLVDDFFPNLQFPSKVEGDWCLVNAGLFRKRVFEELGGYLDSVEEDRELRNRTIAAGCVYYFVDRPLLTKIEMGDSLTVVRSTGYRADRRRRDRDEVWRRNRAYREGLLGRGVKERAEVTIDLRGTVVDEVINPHNLALNDRIPATPETRQWLMDLGLAPETRGAAE